MISEFNFSISRNTIPNYFETSWRRLTMAPHPICIHIGSALKCVLSEPDSISGTISPLGGGANSVNQYGVQSGSPSGINPTRRSLSRLPAGVKLKQRILHKYGSTLRLHLKIPDHHASTKLRRKPRIHNLRPSNGTSSNSHDRYLPVIILQHKESDQHHLNKLRRVPEFSSLRIAAGYFDRGYIPGQQPLDGKFAMFNRTLQPSKCPFDISMLSNLTAVAVPAVATGDGIRIGEEQAYDDDWQLPARIMVSSSTLEAYSEMRGNNDKATWQFGPLHNGLYFHPKREHPDGRKPVLPMPNNQNE